MANNFSAYLENKILGLTLLGSSFTALNTVWLSLATSVTSDGAQFTEVTTNIGYSRQPLATGIDWSDITSTPDTTVVNSTDVTFSSATSAWGTVVGFSLVDSSTIGSGNQLYWGTLSTSRDIQFDDIFEIRAGNLTIRLD